MMYTSSMPERPTSTEKSSPTVAASVCDGTGDNVKTAQKLAYATADKIEFAGKQYRRDIGYRAIRR